MEVSVISDRLSSVAKIQAQSAAKFLIDRQSFQIYAVAKPTVKSRNVKTAGRRVLTRRRRTKRISRTEGGGGGPDDGIFDGIFGGDGTYGGTGGGGWGGSGGDNNGFGGFNWDEPDPASYKVNLVLCWIVFLQCLHFALKKILRSMTNGIAEPSVEREKVPLRLTTVC